MERRHLYLSRRGEPHGEVPPVGILVANLGTPDAPTARALRPYLREFLRDPRVIELPRWRWLPILYLFVLTLRPQRSARLYANIWTEEGSPLLVHSKRIAAGIEERLSRRLGTPLRFALGMRYGNPSLSSALRKLGDAGCQKILVLPLFPQYFSGSTGSLMEALNAEFAKWRWIPELRTISCWHDEPGYIDALATNVCAAWGEAGPAERVLLSFHGIPLRYFLDGDPYYCHCEKTGRLLAERLGLQEGRWQITYQSLFGREEWLKPYSDLTLEALAEEGVRSVDVVCPGFVTDCLETLDEIGREARECFLEAGGEHFRFLPGLNDRPEHLDFLTDLAERHLGGWVDPASAYDREASEREAELSARRAENARRDYPSEILNPA